MTDQRELDRLLGAFFVDGANELADRVIDAALDQIDHTHQRHAMRMPRRFETMPMYTRLAAAAVIGVLAVGGALYLMQPGQPTVGGPGPSSPVNATPGPTAARTPGPTPATTPDIPALTGPLGDGRQIHTATTLTDGRVLVAGGYDNKDAPIATAVLYDPATNAFNPTGSLTAARGEQSSTLLADGRVLIAGGGIAGWVFTGDFLDSAELYDPATGTFGPTGSLGTPREAHTATLLNDGRVLIIGGVETQSRSLASAEIYDPTTGTFSATGPMRFARAWHTATLLADGRVLVTGGWPAAWSSSTTLASAEIYDPSTGTFTATGSMTVSRSFHSATLLGDGRVLVVGGFDGQRENLASAETWDPSTGTFTPTGTLAEGRQYHTADRLADGRVLVSGGGGDYTNTQFLASAEIFDPTTDTFAPTGSMAEARTWGAGALLKDGRVLVTGGYGDLAPLASAELFDPVTGTFSPAGAGG
jgi:Galactose oxidase, central domain/Kelch motif